MDASFPRLLLSRLCFPWSPSQKPLYLSRLCLFNTQHEVRHRQGLLQLCKPGGGRGGLPPKARNRFLPNLSRVADIGTRAQFLNLSNGDVSPTYVAGLSQIQGGTWAITFGKGRGLHTG